MTPDQAQERESAGKGRAFNMENAVNNVSQAAYVGNQHALNSGVAMARLGPPAPPPSPAVALRNEAQSDRQQAAALRVNADGALRLADELEKRAGEFEVAAARLEETMTAPSQPPQGDGE